ncbi:class I SAM-dependent methyltransferase [Candidatus Pelagibacter sp.]|nr:class I SAM-dependent methyltransferase [Candidatus Pelagibacter sp.]|tara:strand:+ start:287 stop:1003 length:717 start_codon:yes stop_codon:yes gene_type:complete
MPSLKNWDNKTWISSRKYIESFNNFVLKQKKLNKDSKILDIGCGRGKIVGTLSSKLRLKNKPIGIDITNHKDKDKRIKFKKIDALSFFLKNKDKFDLILIKQTIHLLNLDEIKKLLILSKKNLSPSGRIFIFALDTDKNQLPTFKLMKIKLIKSLKRDKKILTIITKLYPYRIKKFFIYKVEMIKKNYLKMIQNRYISTLLPLSKKELLKGVKEINLKYKDNIKFNDKLICIILKNAY